MDEAQGIAVVVIDAFFASFGTFGNVLVILAILKTPQLRRRPSNYLILSLAIADLIVTMIAQPLAAVHVLLKTVANRCNTGVDIANLMTGTLSAGTSINHLAAISIDRALATVKPHKHHSIMKQLSKKMLIFCWGTVAIGAIAYFSVQKTTGGKTAALIFTVVAAIFICVGFLLMIGSYVVIFWRIRFPKVQPAIGSSTARDRAMEKRVSGTIAIVILLFAACWFPIVGYRLSDPDQSAHCSYDLTQIWIRTLCLTNSSMNFIVYSLRIRQFRKAYVRIINRMLQPLRQIVGRCVNNDINVTPVPPSRSTPSLSKEMKELSETIN